MITFTTLSSVISFWIIWRKRETKSTIFFMLSEIYVVFSDLFKFESRILYYLEHKKLTSNHFCTQFPYATWQHQLFWDRYNHLDHKNSFRKMSATFKPLPTSLEILRCEDKLATSYYSFLWTFEHVLHCIPTACIRSSNIWSTPIKSASGLIEGAPCHYHSIYISGDVGRVISYIL